MKAHPSPPPSLPSSPTNSTLPTPLPNKQTRLTASAKRYKYLRRIFRFRQMDFEFATWQMIYLFVSPQKVYRNFQYRKQTKDQFARDDPAFLVLLSICLFVSSIAFALQSRFYVLSAWKLLLWVVFIDCIGVGLIVATIFWFITNHYFRKPTCMDQDVEWGYAFDVHLNAFFPLLVILHIFQLIFFELFNRHLWIFGIFFGNSFWFLAIGYYIYITFLGYSALPILKNTQFLLYPVIPLFFGYVISLIFKLNLCEMLKYFYADRLGA